MICPVCETPALEDAAECATCGKVLALEGEIVEEVETIDGLEQTLLVRPGLQVSVESLQVERTPIEADLSIPSTWTVGPVAVERTFQEEDPAVPSNWTVGPLELDSGRAPDGPVRTGEREAPRRPLDDVLCPACFARVPGGPRCVECGVPFPATEVV